MLCYTQRSGHLSTHIREPPSCGRWKLTQMWKMEINRDPECPTCRDKRLCTLSPKWDMISLFPTTTPEGLGNFKMVYKSLGGLQGNCFLDMRRQVHVKIIVIMATYTRPLKAQAKSPRIEAGTWAWNPTTG